MGARIHDSAYNKAAQALSAMGNLRAAAELCETAARENANGELLYNEYNFANLVFAYTGSARYSTLQASFSLGSRPRSSGGVAVARARRASSLP